MATKTPRVAVVDDDPFVLRGLRRLLGSANFEVETYQSGADFLMAIADCEPDCVVLDLHMPQASGFDVQARLAHSGRSVPVVVITGDDTPEARSRALSLGASAYLCKPVDKKALLEAIAAAMAAE
jgi:FixJ family two-component response regulator